MLSYSKRDKDRFPTDEVAQQINKRLTLNLLIQGAAMHSFLTQHHLVKDELEAIKPGLTAHYDKAASCLSLAYFVGEILALCGLPSWFWRRTHRRKHIFYGHRLLATHGQLLWKESKKYMLERARAKDVCCWPVLHSFQLAPLLEPSEVEIEHEITLIQLAKRANQMMWGFPEERTEAHLGKDVAFGQLQTPKTRAGQILRLAAVGYGGVQRENGDFKVVAKAVTFPLVLHELTKGTAELVCLHGLNNLGDELYQKVTDHADQLELETWLLQAGSEMWRRFLKAIPRNQTIPQVLMQVSRLEPMKLESLMINVVEDQAKAKQILQSLD